MSKDSPLDRGVHAATTCSSQKATPSQSRSLASLLTSPKSLRKLVGRRRSSESSNSVVSDDLRSSLSSPISPSTPTTRSILSPRTPHNEFSLAGQAEKSKASYRAIDCAQPPITKYELTQIWSHAIHLADMGRLQSSRLLFKHLINRYGVPPYFLPLLAMNSGLLMLREHAIFPALHMFYVISHEMCLSGPLHVLGLFAVGVSAGHLAGNGSNANTNANAPNGDGHDVSKQTLLRARDFFNYASAALDGNDECNYHCFGFEFTLTGDMIQNNKNSCEQVLEKVRRTGSMRSLASLPIEKLPPRALFMPIELQPRPAISRTQTDIPQPSHFKTVEDHLSGNRPMLERSMSDEVLTAGTEIGAMGPTLERTFQCVQNLESLMKPLPPLPLNTIGGSWR